MWCGVLWCGSGVGWDGSKQSILPDFTFNTLRQRQNCRYFPGIKQLIKYLATSETYVLLRSKHISRMHHSQTPHQWLQYCHTQNSHKFIGKTCESGINAYQTITKLQSAKHMYDSLDVAYNIMPHHGLLLKYYDTCNYQITCYTMFVPGLVRLKSKRSIPLFYIVY